MTSDVYGGRKATNRTNKKKKKTSENCVERLSENYENEKKLVGNRLFM